MEYEDNITITDDHGFVYRVRIKHWPDIGLSIAYHDLERIASREYGRMRPPITDDDREWEAWEERFREWADEVIMDLTLACQQHFNNKYVQAN